MTAEEAKHLAEHWVEAWNSHDLDAILSHYAHDLEMTTPRSCSILGIQSGTLRDKKAVGDY